MRYSLGHFFLLPVIVGAAFLAVGCADFKLYTRDRGNDLADCFTARVGLGYGIGVRAQVTDYAGYALGWSVKEKRYGFYGREQVRYEASWLSFPPITVFAFPWFGIVGLHSRGPHKADFFEGVLIFFSPLLWTEMRNDDFKYEKSADINPDKSELSHFYTWGVLGIRVPMHVYDPFVKGKIRRRTDTNRPFIRERFFIEAGVNLGAVGFDIGFNPVEFVDFLLGWTTLDITGDDAWKNAQSLSESPSKPVP